jgi:hypothetical protein
VLQCSGIGSVSNTVPVLLNQPACHVVVIVIEGQVQLRAQHKQMKRRNNVNDNVTCATFLVRYRCVSEGILVVHICPLLQQNFRCASVPILACDSCK